MQRIAFVLMGVGVMIIIGYFVRGFFLSSSLPLALRVAVGAIGGGIIIVLISVIRERYKAAKEEDFKEVDK